MPDTRAREEALEEAALECEGIAKGDTQYLRLHCGEMSAQEVRTVRAVLKWMANRIRALKEHPHG